jgi:protein required for attachment to host cells
MKKDTWFLVANTSVARIYKVGPQQSLIQVEVLTHPESRLHNQDLVTDKPGRDFESVGSARHSFEPRTWPKQNEFHIFAKLLSEHLEKALNNGSYEKLYLAASPALLGLLRQELKANTQKHISGELDKDMTQMKPEELIQQVPFLFYS